MGCSQSSPEREVCSNTILPQETGRALKRQPNFTPKTTVKRRTTTTKKKKPKISRRKEIIKKWTEVNERNNSKD